MGNLFRMLAVVLCGFLLMSCSQSPRALTADNAKPISMPVEQPGSEQPDFFDLYPLANTYQGAGSIY